MSLNKLLSFARLRRGVVAISLLAGAALLALQVTSVGADYSVILEGSGTRLQDGSCQVEAKVTVKDGRSKSPPLKITFDENCEPQLRAMTEAEYRALPQAPNDLPDEGAPAATATAPVAQTPASISVADGPLSVGDRIADLLE